VNVIFQQQLNFGKSTKRKERKKERKKEKQ
jgi:hypothetical protein